MAALIETISPRRDGLRAMQIGDVIDRWGLDALGTLLQTTMGRTEEPGDASFAGLTLHGYLRNSVVFACLAVRARLFSDARFTFQQMRGGRPGNLFGTPALSVLERPETGKTTRDLLQVAILDADLGGNAFVKADSTTMRRLRPDWTSIAYASKRRAGDLGAWDPDADVLGFGFHPGGYGSAEDVIAYGPEEVAHFAPTKDPLARNRGISLLVAGLREVMADNGATTSKLAFFEHAATPNLALKFPPTMTKEKALEWIELFEQDHRGALNGARTMYLGAGVEPMPVGLTLVEQDFAKIQGKAETRIAALTGVHPVVVALSEGLAGSSLNAGNFGSAARLVGDATLRPLWGDIASSLETIVPPLPGTRLWFDDRDIAFLRSDVKDQAEITQMNATAIGSYIKDGFTAASAIEAVITSDPNRLVHTGLTSVQLQAPIASSSAYRVRDDFWALDEPYASFGRIERGIVVPPGPLVGMFPSLFESVDEPARLGPGLIVTREAVLAKRAELVADGRPSGYEALAAALGVSPATIRRRLQEPT